MIKMLVAAKVRPEKIVELEQTLCFIKRDLESSECRMNFILCRVARQLLNICIIFSWDNEQDFECSLDKIEFRVVCGAVKVLCEDSSYFCNSLSEKWNRLSGNYPQPQHTRTLPEEIEMLRTIALGLDRPN